MLKWSVILPILILAQAGPALADDGGSYAEQCEAEILARLKSPSSYKQVSATSEFSYEMTEEHAKYVLPNVDCHGNPAPYDPSRDCSHSEDAMTTKSGTWHTVIVFDAQNTYGAILRGGAECYARVKDKYAAPYDRLALKLNFID